MPKATKTGASNAWEFPPLSEEQVEALHPEVAEAREAAEKEAAKPVKRAAAKRAPRKKA